MKQCIECGDEFRTFVPKQWFDGERLLLGHGYPASREEVQAIIDRRTCDRHTEEEDV